MIELIAGGARSGKSRYAQDTAESLTPAPLLVATATADDADMAERIRLHQKSRGAHWDLVEEPLHLARIIDSMGAKDVVVVDCLTLWLSNWLCRHDPDGWVEERDAFLAALASTLATLFLVTNEVGMGVVPMGKLSRNFVDQSGWLHQEIARQADRVTIMHFGIPVVIKGPN